MASPILMWTLIANITLWGFCVTVLFPSWNARTETETNNSSIIIFSVTENVSEDLTGSYNVGKLNTLETTTVEGMIVSTREQGVVTIALPSLETKTIFSATINDVAWDWNSRKIYWAHNTINIMRANLDGTEVEDVVTEVRSYALDVDSMTGNVYFGDFNSHEIKVCSTRNTEKCSLLATNQSNVFDIAVYPSKSLLFWSNQISIVRANMDGTNAAVIVSADVWYFDVDQDEDRLYWNDRYQNFISSSDLNGKDRRVVVKSPTDGGYSDLYGIAVHGDVIYWGRFDGEMVESVSKDGGNVTLIRETTGYVNNIVMYGSKTFARENPCAGSPCSHLCVLKLESFACLCPEGEQLDHDRRACI